MTLPDGTTLLGLESGGRRDGRGSLPCGVRRRFGLARVRPAATPWRRRFARVAASTAVLLALACAAGAHAAALSLSDVKMGARTGADEWEYVALSDGADRNNGTLAGRYWLIHVPNYHRTGSSDLDVSLTTSITETNDDGNVMIWPFEKRTTKSQNWVANAVWGGLFDYAGSNRYWLGLREWDQQFHANWGKGVLGTLGGFKGFSTQPTSKENAYQQMRAWWRGSNSGVRSSANTSFDGSQHTKHFISKTLYNYYHPYTVAFWPEKLDVVGAEVGEDTALTVAFQQALVRGAGRQYGKPWGIDFSDWWLKRISDYGGWWQTASEDANACWDVETSDGVLLWRTSGNKSYWKPPVASWDARLLFSDSQEIEIGDSDSVRFVVRTTGYVKVGSHSSANLNYWSRCCDWTNIRGDGTSSGVKEILAASGNRVMMRLTDDSVVIRGTGGADATFAGQYVKGELSGNHILLLKKDGTLGRKTLASIVTGNYAVEVIDTGVTDMAVAGSHVLYQKTNGRLYYKADLTTGAPVEVRSGAVADNNAGVSEIALDVYGGATRIGVLYGNGVLRVGATPSSIAAAGSKLLEHVSRFKLGGNRIAAVQQGDEGMQVLKVRDGLSGSWVPMMFVRMADFGLSSGGRGNALFVQTERDQKILVKNRGLEQREWAGTKSSDKINYRNNYIIWSSHTGDGGVPPSQIWGGHSESLMRRVYYYAYMGGANILWEEAGGVFFFLGRRNTLARDTNGNETGAPTLSREGVMAKHYYDFTKHVFPHGERGIPWIPVAVVVDHYDLMGNAAGYLTKTAADTMNENLFYTLWPRHEKNDPEYNILPNSPYGELFDVLTDTASADVIANYPVLLMSGEIRPDAALRTKLKNYVNGGGNLVINAAMNVADFGVSFTGVTLGTAASRSVPGLRWEIDDATTTFSSAWTVSAQPMTLSNGASALLTTTDSTAVTLASIRTHGQGRVIVVGMPNLPGRECFRQTCLIWDFLLKKLSENRAVNPFSVSGDIMYQVNYKDLDTWIVTLTNNRGVGKGALTLQTFDPGQARTVTIKLRESGRAVSSVTEYPIFHGIWKTPSGATAHSNNAFTVSVGPGQTRVFKVATQASG